MFGCKGLKLLGKNFTFSFKNCSVKAKLLTILDNFGDQLGNKSKFLEL